MSKWLKAAALVLFTPLLGCQDVELFSWIRQPTTQLRFGLFSQKDSGPLNMRTEKETPQAQQILWARMRQNFKLNYDESNPRIKRYINEYTKTNYYANQLSKNASIYLYTIVEELDKRGLPHELALLPMVESNFDPLAVSQSGAGGLWQIMPTTGHLLGLKQDFWYDGRKDIKASTIGALNHLQYLYRLFDEDWLLALAAYNAGERRVIKAIEHNKKKKKPTDFWHLDLPKETQNYVPKLLALSAIVKNPINHNVNLPAIANKPHAVSVDVHHQIDLEVVAELSGECLSTLQKLNPALHHGATHPKGPHVVMVPAKVADQFTKKIRRVNPDSLTCHTLHLVEAGDTLSSIAKKYNTSVHTLNITNDLQNSTLHPGTTLFIPSQKIIKDNPSLVHTVKKGESLWSISKKYEVEIKDVVAWNNLQTQNLQPGQELIIRA